MTATREVPAWFDLTEADPRIENVSWTDPCGCVFYYRGRIGSKSGRKQETVRCDGSACTRFCVVCDLPLPSSYLTRPVDWPDLVHNDNGSDVHASCCPCSLTQEEESRG